MKYNNSPKFLVMIILFLLIFIATISGLLLAPIASAKFSEIWLLSPDNLTNYPVEIKIDERQTVVIGVGNHMGYSQDYIVYAKICDNTQNLPNFESANPSTVDAINEFSFSIDDGAGWEENVCFSFDQFFIQYNVLTVQSISFNDVSFPIDFTTSLNSEKNSFDVNLFFELWRYNVVTEKFEFDNRFVGIWLTIHDLN